MAAQEIKLYVSLKEQSQTNVKQKFILEALHTTLTHFKVSKDDWDIFAEGILRLQKLVDSGQQIASGDKKMEFLMKMCQYYKQRL